MLLAAVAAVAVEGEKAAGAGPLSFDLWTFVFQAANVLIIMLLLWKLVWGPLGRIVSQREKTIESSLAKASEAKAEAERLLSEYQSRIDDAQRQAQAIIDKAVKAGEETRQRIVGEAEAEAERNLARAKADIAREREKALAAIRDEVANLAILAASKVVGKAITEEDHRRMVRDFVAEVSLARVGDAREDGKAGDVA